MLFTTAGDRLRVLCLCQHDLRVSDQPGWDCPLESQGHHPQERDHPGVRTCPALVTIRHSLGAGKNHSMYRTQQLKGCWGRLDFVVIFFSSTSATRASGKILNHRLGCQKLLDYAEAQVLSPIEWSLGQETEWLRSRWGGLESQRKKCWHKSNHWHQRPHPGQSWRGGGAPTTN